MNFVRTSDPIVPSPPAPNNRERLVKNGSVTKTTVNDRVAFCKCFDIQREGKTTTFTYAVVCRVIVMSVTVFDENSKFVDEEKRKFIATSGRRVFNRKVFQKLFKYRLPSAYVHRVQTNNVYD